MTTLQAQSSFRSELFFEQIKEIVKTHYFTGDPILSYVRMLPPLIVLLILSNKPIRMIRAGVLDNPRTGRDLSLQLAHYFTEQS